MDMCDSFYPVKLFCSPAPVHVRPGQGPSGLSRASTDLNKHFFHKGKSGYCVCPLKYVCYVTDEITGGMRPYPYMSFRNQVHAPLPRPVNSQYALKGPVLQTLMYHPPALAAYSGDSQ